MSDRDQTGDLAPSRRRRTAYTTRNVLVTITCLFAIFAVVLMMALTLSPIISSLSTPLEVYQFLVRLSALWAGLTWLSASIYLSFITEAREFSTEIWLAFLVGALMSYIGVGGVFPEVPYWLGVRTMMYGVISLVPIALILNIQSQLGDDRPPITVIALLREWSGRL